jgi:hypothetical protein
LGVFVLAYLFAFVLVISIPAELGLLAVAPFGEESVKLFAALALLRGWSSAAGFRGDIAKLPARVVLYPVIVGISFGVLEHFHTYAYEALSVFGARVVLHVLYVTLGFGIASFSWGKGMRFLPGLWLGLAMAVLTHSLANAF